MHTFPVNSATKLDTQSYTPPIPSPMPITIVKPVSYQFQVVEYVDTDNKIVKVELQAQATTHDENGNVMYSSGFKPVPRVQLPFVEYSK